MKIGVVVKVNARKEAVEKLADGTLRVSVNASPQEGQANDAVVRLLARHFGVARSAVRIATGARSKKKIIEVLS